MAENDTMASRLYGGTTPELATAANAQQANARQAAADRLYGDGPALEARDDVPEAVRALRDADAGRRLFSADKTFAAALPDGALEGVDMREAREVLADIGAGADDAQQLLSLVHQDEPEEGWRVQSERLIAEKTISNADLDAARQLVQRDPRLVQFLDRTQLGNCPAVVLRMVELARTARAAGKLPHPTAKERK